MRYEQRAVNRLRGAAKGQKLKNNKTNPKRR
jgi:hypothetical protein